MTKTIVYWSYGARIEYTPHPAIFDEELRRLDEDDEVECVSVKESE